MCGVLGILDVYKYMCITCVADTCVIHIFYTCITHVFPHVYFFYFILFSNVFLYLVHDCTLSFIGYPCCSVSYYNYI